MQNLLEGYRKALCEENQGIPLLWSCSFIEFSGRNYCQNHTCVLPWSQLTRVVQNGDRKKGNHESGWRSRDPVPQTLWLSFMFNRITRGILNSQSILKKKLLKPACWIKVYFLLSFMEHWLFFWKPEYILHFQLFKIWYLSGKDCSYSWRAFCQSEGITRAQIEDLGTDHRVCFSVSKLVENLILITVF